MLLTNRDFVQSLRRSRDWFLKHVSGMTEEQARFKPYPQCKSVLETLVHLIAGDRAALESLETGEQVPYSKVQPEIGNLPELMAMLRESHAALLGRLNEDLGGASIDRPISVWGEQMPAAIGLAFLASEDYYHSGQVAYIRLATDPAWDYDSAIFGDD